NPLPWVLPTDSSEPTDTAADGLCRVQRSGCAGGQLGQGLVGRHRQADVELGGQQCCVPKHLAQLCRQGVPVLVGDQPAAVAEDPHHLPDVHASPASQSHCHIGQSGHGLDIASAGEDGGPASFELVCVEVVRHPFASANCLACSAPPATPTPAT